MSNIDKLEQIVNELYDSTENKEDIANFTRLSDAIKAVREDYTAKENEYKEIFSDYKEMVKHTSFTPERNQVVDINPEPPKFEDFLNTLHKH